jgi:hypothetical protein
LLQIGPLIGFCKSDSFIVDGAKAAFAGLQNNDANIDIQISIKDSQSSSNRASEVMADLI